jgi:5-hydroxyisourate hydrolase-like protein (transthyretin family)
MGRLTTHALDTATGKPTVWMRIDFVVLDATQWPPITAVPTCRGS